MLYLAAAGDAAARGRRHGERLAGDIRGALEAWAKGIPAGLTPGAERIRDYLERHRPATLAELDGIAAGAGLPAERVFLLSFFNSLKPLPGGCTSFALRGRDGRFVLGKTQDIGPVESRYQLTTLVTDEAGRRALVVGLAGAVWTVAGINDRGLAVAANSAPFIPAGFGAAGLPQHHLFYPVLLECDTVEQARAFVERHPLAGKGTNAVLADRGPKALVYEGTAGFRAWAESASGSLFTANHFRRPSMLAHNNPDYPALENSRQRTAHLERRVEGLSFADPAAEAAAVLGEHGFTGAVCQSVPELGMSSRYGFVIDPARFDILVTSDPAGGRYASALAAIPA